MGLKKIFYIVFQSIVVYEFENIDEVQIENDDFVIILSRVFEAVIMFVDEFVVKRLIRRTVDFVKRVGAHEIFADCCSYHKDCS